MSCSAPVWPVWSSTVRYASTRSAADRVWSTTTEPSASATTATAVAKRRKTTATASPRGSRRRCRSRTSGFSRKAITDAARKRKSTWPSVPASIQPSTSRTGRPTSWIQRGIRIVGPLPGGGGTTGARARVSLSGHARDRSSGSDPRPCRGSVPEPRSGPVPVEDGSDVRYGGPDGHAALPASGPSPRTSSALAAAGAPPRRARDRRRARSRHPPPDGIRLRHARAAGGAGRRRHGAVDGGRAPGARGRRHGRQPAAPASRRGRGGDRDRVPRRAGRRPRAAAGGQAGERGAPGPSLAQDRRDAEERARLVPARNPGHRGGRRRSDARHGRVRPGRRDGGRDLRLRDRRQGVRLPHRPAPDRGSRRDRLAHPRPAGPVPRRGVADARRGRRSWAPSSTRPRSSARRWPSTRAAPATTWRSRCTPPPARCPSAA